MQVFVYKPYSQLLSFALDTSPLIRHTSVSVSAFPVKHNGSFQHTPNPTHSVGG